MIRTQSLPVLHILTLFLLSCTTLATSSASPSPTSPNPPATAPITQLSLPTAAPTPPPVVEPWGQRKIISLDGGWQVVRVSSLEDPLPKSGWESFQVPGVLYGYNYERAWFRRTFKIDAALPGQRLILRFGGVKYNSRILVNGKQVASHFNGYDSFEVDITGAVKWGRTNLLQVGVHDWTGVFSAGPTLDLASWENDWYDLRTAPRDRVLAPVGGHFDYYGIWDSVSLTVVPPVYISSFFIRSSIRENYLAAEIAITNSGSSSFTGALHGRIFPWNGAGRDESGQWTLQGEDLATIPSLEITLLPAKTQVFTISLQNPPLRSWSPEDPQLYVLEISLDQPSGDTVRERFGWRDFYREKGDFYLNSKKIHLLAASWWPEMGYWTREQIKSQLQATQAANVVAFRTHTQPWPEIWYEVADEIGLIMIPEGAVWNDDTSYRVNDLRFWKNYTDHLTAMVRTLGNHPSVVMWSLENEFFGERINNDTPVAEKRLADLALLIKRLDPTRPITFESDGDPGGATDVIGIHYPNEYPDHRLWPQDAYWLDKPRDLLSNGEFFWDDQVFLWDRSKPLYIGEYLWEPSNDPSTHTVMVGDEAYINHARYRTLAKAFAWQMQILAHRYFGVSGHSPWAVTEEGNLDESNPTWRVMRDMYRPLAAFLLDYDSRFFSGEKVRRRVGLFNDTMSDLAGGRFRWTLLQDDQVIDQGEEKIALLAGEHVERMIELSLPETSGAQNLVLRLTIDVNAQEKFREEYPLQVYSRGLHLTGIPIALYDPKNTFTEVLRRYNISFTSIDNLQAWNEKDVLVIAPDALLSSVEPDTVPTIGAQNELGEALRAKIKAGGRVLVLEQSHHTPSGILPLTLRDTQSTLTFIQAPAHPILLGLSDADLRWWRGDYLVTKSESYRQNKAGMHALVTTGDNAGISHAPLIEIHQEQGMWLICQILVANKFEEEPMAQILFERMLRYLSDYRPAEGKIVYTPANWTLSALKIGAQPLQSWDELAFPAVRLLILHENNETIPWELLQSFLEAGGSILWDRPPAQINTFLKSLNTAVEMQPWSGSSLRSEGNHPLLDFLTREDLYWIDKPSKDLQTPSKLAANTNAVFLSKNDPISSTQDPIPAAEGAILEGDFIQKQGDEIIMATNGRVTWNINLPQDGSYQFVLFAYGTPVSGDYPQAQVTVDNVAIGSWVVASENSEAYQLIFNGKAGEHQLSVAFVNDAYNPPEDRNLFLVGYMVLPMTEIAFAGLTSPPSVASLPVGKGELTLSAVEWDAAGANSVRGQRFFAGLLTGLGVTYAGGSAPLSIEAESFTPMPNFPYFEIDEEYAFMATDGYIETPLRIIRAGKYRLGILAKGTPVNKIYPILQVELGDRVLGRTDIIGRWEMHDLYVELSEETSFLRISFINDEAFPEIGEDRNVWIDRIEFDYLE